ncbi:MAG: OmpA family protein, partial [Bacteroidetes bacterium]|nr:OmpA family protein [Bacteroidota bacterium]
MKRIICIILLGCLVSGLSAQLSQEKKPSTLIFHVFYNDFKTAQLMKTTSLKIVLDKGLWSEIGDMQMGFGFNYLKGISKKIDAIAAIDGSSTDYLFKNGSTNGSSKFLLDANAALNLKLLTDSHTLVPYFSIGAGLSSYKGKTGFYIPAGAGIQFNLFKEAFVLTNIQYRHALTSTVNDHFYYSVGVGTNIGKKKKTIALPEEIKVPELVIVQNEIKLAVKNLRVMVTDDQTGFPLSAVEVTVNGSAGKFNGLSDASGEVSFSAVQVADYIVIGVLNGITTSNQNLSKNSFDVSDQEIIVSISHHDPRFTLAGRVNNKSTHNPESNVILSVVNTTKNSIINQQNQLNGGTFSIPLEAASDFTISGKKAGYISNIEKVSTKGLNRNTTLYVKLELEIEEAAPDKVIALTNIYYDSGSSRIRPDASSDLGKLIKFLSDNPDFTIEIASHSDSRGSDASNLVLSQARAQEVVNYMQRNGINKNRLIPKGYGETMLINGCANGVNCKDAQHEQNRRTEFKV